MQVENNMPFHTMPAKQISFMIMNTKPAAFNNSGKGKIIFTLSIFVSGYWWLCKTLDVYRYDFTGAICEILWLQGLALLFFLPVISIFLLIKEKKSFKSLYLYSVLITVSTIVFLVFSK